MIVDETCVIGGGLFRSACGRPATGRCVYCGRTFCPDHGERGEDFIEACSRSKCRAKLRDVVAHQQWRKSVEGSNGVSVCAQERCEQRMRAICYRCRLLFCEDHLRERSVADRRSNPPQRIPALVCAHCNDRRRLWD